MIQKACMRPGQHWHKGRNDINAVTLVTCRIDLGLSDSSYRPIRPKPLIPMVMGAMFDNVLLAVVIQKNEYMNNDYNFKRL